MKVLDKTRTYRLWFRIYRRLRTMRVEHQTLRIFQLPEDLFHFVLSNSIMEVDSV